MQNMFEKRKINKCWFTENIVVEDSGKLGHQVSKDARVKARDFLTDE